MKITLVAIAAVLVLPSCMRAGPNLPFRVGLPVPCGGNRQADAKALYQGRSAGRSDRLHGRQPDPALYYGNYTEPSEHIAFATGYDMGYTELPGQDALP